MINPFLVILLAWRPRGRAGASPRREHVVAGRPQPAASNAGDFQIAAAVAAFGMLLRDSAYRGEATYDMVLELAQPGLADDANGYRSEFVRLVRQAQQIDRW